MAQDVSVAKGGSSLASLHTSPFAASAKSLRSATSQRSSQLPGLSSATIAEPPRRQIETKFGGYTPLMRAAAQGDMHEVVRHIGEPELDLFVTDNQGRTALEWAVLGGFESIQGTLEDAMVEEVAKREKQREAQERKDQLERLVERNTRLRAMTRSMSTSGRTKSSKKCVDGSASRAATA